MAHDIQCEQLVALNSRSNESEGLSYGCDLFIEVVYILLRCLKKVRVYVNFHRLNPYSSSCVEIYIWLYFFKVYILIFSSYFDVDDFCY